MTITPGIGQAVAAMVAAVVAVAGARALLGAWGPSVEAEHAGATLMLAVLILGLLTVGLAAWRNARS